MAERILIVKVVRTTATQADLYGARHKYKDLTLFNVAELATVGIDPAGLAIGEETPARFWAIYELSDKLNRAGRPYKDILALEPMDTPATSTSAAVGDPAILAELRAIRALLAVLVEAQGLALPDLEEQDPDPGENGDGNGPAGNEDPPGAEPPGRCGELARAFPRYGDGQPVSDNPAELAAYNAHLEQVGQPPASLGALRAWARTRNGKH